MCDPIFADELSLKCPKCAATGPITISNFHAIASATINNGKVEYSIPSFTTESYSECGVCGWFGVIRNFIGV